MSVSLGESGSGTPSPTNQKVAIPEDHISMSDGQQLNVPPSCMRQESMSAYMQMEKNQAVQGSVSSTTVCRSGLGGQDWCVPG